MEYVLYTSLPAWNLIADYGISENIGLHFIMSIVLSTFNIYSSLSFKVIFYIFFLNYYYQFDYITLIIKIFTWKRCVKKPQYRTVDGRNFFQCKGLQSQIQNWFLSFFTIYLDFVNKCIAIKMHLDTKRMVDVVISVIYIYRHICLMPNRCKAHRLSYVN